MSDTQDPNRREFLQGSLAAAGVAALESAAPTAAAAQGKSAKKPNIVFFLGEGHRWDALSLEGHPLVKTPNHDRIGREGMRFKNAFVTNALCAPARAVALTGMYSRTTGALDNEGVMTSPLPADIPLFTDILKKEGYDIVMAGKVHIRNGVEERNWNYYFGHNAPGNNYNDPIFKEGRNGEVGKQKHYGPVYPDDLTVDKVLEWMDQRKSDKPFCLCIWFVAPHAPFYRARRHLDLYNGAPIPKPDTFDDDLKGWPGKPKAFIEATNKIGTTTMGDTCRTLEEVAKDYYAGLVAVDENIGKVFKYLEKKKILDDTAILHTSDHGYFMGEWRCFDKRFMHEPSIRVPLMVRYPKKVPAGVVREEMALGDLDIAPTVLDIVGIPTPASMQGKSLIPLAKNADPEFRKEWFYEYFEWPNPENVRPHRGIRTERHKLIHYNTVQPAQYEMYDLKSDPGEKNNLWNKPAHAALQKDLLARLDRLDAATPKRKSA